MNVTEKLSFFDLIYQRNLTPAINKPTMVEKIQQRLLITS